MSTITRNRVGSTSHRVAQPALDSVLTWLLVGRHENSPWRLVAAAAAIAEATAHMPVIAVHLTEAPYIGVSFVLLTVAGFLLAQLLLTADTRAVWMSTAVVSALALAAFIYSRTVGLPMIEDHVGDWSDPLGTVAIVSEAVMLAAAILHLTRHRSRA